jgi:hypothetical protein
MNKQMILKSLILSAVAATGLATAAFAGGDEPNSPAAGPAMAAAPATDVAPSSGPASLLGQKYAGLTYRYIDIDGPGGHADHYSFNFNEPLKAGLDGLLSFDWTEMGAATRQLSISAGLRAYRAAYAWGTPYVEAGAGYIREKIAGVKDDSFLWQLGIGAEFPVAPAVTVTPYINYADAPSLSGNGRWDFGVKASYWVNQNWAVTAGIDRDDDQNTGFMVGTNFRY